jgi:hypothetical protein
VVATAAHPGWCRARRAIAFVGLITIAAQAAAGPVAAATPQTIAFALPPSAFVGSTVVLDASADSGLPVAYEVTTPGTCDEDGTDLHLLAPGTCTVTASQSGDETYDPAPDVAASMLVEAVPQGIDLGRYAVNGPVLAVAADAATGRTYLGGDFTQIGVRTGPVAVVDLPGDGDGSLRPGSPEVLGTVGSVFADDRPGDPGVLLVGELLAVNGDPVPAVPVTRLHVDESSRWVVDPGWSMDAAAEGCSALGTARPWIATPEALITAGSLSPADPVALWRVDRATGACTRLLPASTPPMPQLAACASLPYCGAEPAVLATDDDAGRLAVAYSLYAGETSGSTVWTTAVTTFDLGSRDRLWTTSLQGPPPPGEPNWRGIVTSLGITGDTVLLRGSFPFHAQPDDATMSHAVAIDAADGHVTQRWNSRGEENLDDGSVLGPAGGCLTSDRPDGPLFALDGGTAGWVGLSASVAMLCRYEATGSGIDASGVGGVTTAPGGGAHTVPTLAYVAPGGERYLLDGRTAVALPDGPAMDWHPDVATKPDKAWALAAAVSSAGVVVVGDFSFVRGRGAPGVVSLTSALAPDPSFASPISAAPTSPHVTSLALAEDRLLVGGQFKLTGSEASDGPTTVIGVDSRTGVIQWQPQGPTPYVVRTIAVDPLTAESWIGGQPTDWSPYSVPLVHVAAPSAGAGSLPVPSLGCLEAPTIDGFAVPGVCGTPNADRPELWSLAVDDAGRLYLGGLFGSVDGAAHRGLARLAANGTVDDWNADLLGAIPMPPGEGLQTLDPLAIAPFGGRVLVGGQFCSIRPSGGGGGAMTCISPLLVFDGDTGALLRPSDPARSPWFPILGWWSSGYAIVARSSGVAVALGDVGVVVLDPATLDLDAAASAPLLSQDWWGHQFGEGVFALGVPATPPVAGQSGTQAARGSRSSSPAAAAIAASAPTERLTIGGSIPRWGYRVAGNVLTASVTATPHPPTISTPTVRPRTGTSLSGTGVPLRLEWTASAAGGPGIDHYEVERSVNGEAWTVIGPHVTGRSLDVVAASSGLVRWRVRAVDHENLASPWGATGDVRPRLVQQGAASVHYGGTWRRTTSPGLSGGSARHARRSGASASYTFTGHAIALVTTRSPTRGRVKVYVNGHHVTTIDLRAPTRAFRAVAWQRTWSSATRRTIRLVVVGTQHRPRVDLDALVVLR